MLGQSDFPLRCLARLGVPDMVIQQILRHSNVSTNRDLLNQDCANDVLNAMNTLEKHIENQSMEQLHRPVSYMEIPSLVGWNPDRPLIWRESGFFNATSDSPIESLADRIIQEESENAQKMGSQAALGRSACKPVGGRR